MKKNAIKTLRDLDIKGLQEKTASLQKEYAVSRMQFKVGRLKNIRSLSTLRYDLAVVKTIISEKEKVNA